MVGILIVKHLIGIDLELEKTIHELMLDKKIRLKNPLIVEPTATLGMMMNSFSKGAAHIALICKDAEQMMFEAEAVLNQILHPHADQPLTVTTKMNLEGLCTFEDVLESVLQVDILDEKDIETWRMQRSGFQSMYEDSRANYTAFAEPSNVNQSVVKAKFAAVFGDQVMEDLREHVKIMKSQRQGLNVSSEKDKYSGFVNREDLSTPMLPK